jgi:glycosyltransferase involved in cell wall biosynthesis
MGALAKEALIHAWRLRRDVHALWTLEDAVCARWTARPGAPVFLLPEAPPAAATAGVPIDFDCVVYGALGRRKGLDLLADAVGAGADPLRILIAGQVLPQDRDFVGSAVARMRAAGAVVTFRDGRIDDSEVPALLGSATSVVLAYPRHKGTSRVLLEAASVGTPVIAHAWGWLGDTVRRRRLGLAVDCLDPATFHTAIGQLRTPGARQRFAAPLSGYAGGHGWAAYNAAVLAPFQPNSESSRTIGGT